jgi:hypothetical protein
MPVPDDRSDVIRVGYNMTVNWESQDINEVNIFFVQENTTSTNEIHIDRIILHRIL